MEFLLFVLMLLWVQVWDLSQRSCLAQAHVDVSPGDTLGALAIDHTVRGPSHFHSHTGCEVRLLSRRS